MKKTTFEQRIENAVDAFFDTDEDHYGENSLSFRNDYSLLEQETAAADFSKKGDILVKILRRTFIFFPGAFYLFFVTVAIFEFDLIRIEPFAIIPAFLIGSFMTIFGIGNVKNPKHLAIPLSIISVGFMAFSLFSIFEKSHYVFEYGIYFFPLALIMAFLARDLADKTDKTAK